ncbi:MAG: hypothetical protein CMC76_00970 [Flavobacteriaceae bacterium]|nr:hypothetical protein [Flavobacteriaceae bacterium]
MVRFVSRQNEHKNNKITEIKSILLKTNEMLKRVQHDSIEVGLLHIVRNEGSNLRIVSFVSSCSFLKDQKRTKKSITVGRYFQ